MELKEEFIAAACNRTYNCLELHSELGILIYAAHQALAVYDIQEAKVLHAAVSHTNRINCCRFLKDTGNKWLLSSDADGQLVLWEIAEQEKRLRPQIIRPGDKSYSITVCDGIKIKEGEVFIGYTTSLSTVFFLRITFSSGQIGLDSPTVTPLQEIDLKHSIALELVFHSLDSSDIVLMALGMDSGSVDLYNVDKNGETRANVSKVCCLKKHEDWVRSIAFKRLENGTTLMATGGQDSFIAIWRLVDPSLQNSNIREFEFQIQNFRNVKVLFDSMVIGHDGWINSLDWSPKGELISCSSDQSIIVWENSGDIWTEKARLGVVGGQTPGGFGAKASDNTLATWGFQGSIQIWTKADKDWKMNPSVTGHFGSVTDLDFHREGKFVVSTSADQTSRIFSTWGPRRWHEIARPQIHGHDIFAGKFCQDFLVSGAEEKILRAFQPTEIFIQSLQATSDVIMTFEHFSPSATLPALGLSNQTGSGEATFLESSNSEEGRLDEDFLRSNTLWPEVSKLFGHVYEISCIATSKNDPLIASASQSSKPQFSGIILWCTKTWRNLGDFKFHKLNVNDMEFNERGDRLLSTSRDRTWAVWDVHRDPATTVFTMEILESGGVHTRALMVGTWVPSVPAFVTGARDKKLIVWKSNQENESKFEVATTHIFKHGVSAIGVNECDGILVAGLESGCLFLFKLSLMSIGENSLELLISLRNGLAHHGTINRLRFNPKNKYELATAGNDQLVKVFQILTTDSGTIS